MILNLLKLNKVLSILKNHFLFDKKTKINKDLNNGFLENEGVSGEKTSSTVIPSSVVKSIGENKNKVR